MKPKLLDLFCGAGGAGMGYHRAGFEVVGVDIEHQPNFPFEFHQADALEFIAEHGSKFDAIHASPPCQSYSTLRALHPDREYPDLILATRAALERSGKPFIIENVQGAPLVRPTMICGSFFGLLVRRHRLFETSFRLGMIPWCKHSQQPNPIDVSGTGSAQLCERKKKTGGKSNKPRGLEEARLAMGIDWMTRADPADFRRRQSVPLLRLRRPHSIGRGVPAYGCLGTRGVQRLRQTARPQLRLQRPGLHGGRIVRLHPVRALPRLPGGH